MSNNNKIVFRRVLLIFELLEDKLITEEASAPLGAMVYNFPHLTSAPIGA